MESNRSDLEKETLRTRMREWRDEVLCEDEHERKSHTVCEVLIQGDFFGPDDLLLGFAPIRGEVDLLPLYRQLPGSVRLALPRVEGSTLGLYEVQNRSDLVRSLNEDRLEEGFERGQHNIIEPDPDHSTDVSPSQLDGILVPGLVFDREGRRIGYGSGYYDRLLSSVPDTVLRIGVCFDEQVASSDLPEDSHDERVDHVVTEEGIQ